MKNWIKNFLTPKVVLIASGLWIGLCVIIGGSIYLIHPPKVVEVVPTAVVTVVLAPTPTEMIKVDTNATAQAASGTQTPGNTFHLGDYVKISDTDNQGLIIRSVPGISNKMLFVAAEGTVFEIKDGPVSAGDFTWWYLVSPADASQFGWAVSDYLKATEKP
jgi:hypothetical protein